MGKNMIDKVLEKISNVYNRINLLLGAIVVVTIFFACFIPRIEVVTIFSDLFPKNHKYIETYNKFKNIFGSANYITICIENKSGDIYNNKYLKKVKYVTDELNKINGVNHYSLISLYSPLLRNVGISPDGVLSIKAVYELIPEDESRMNSFKESVHKLQNVYGPIISFDDKASLVGASFYEEKLDYTVVFNELHRISKSISDKDTAVYVTGYPTLMGWIYQYKQEMFLFFFASFGLIFILTYFKFRSIMMTVIPFGVFFLSTFWGLGVIGLLGYNLDPLVIIILLVQGSRALSHSTQIALRYFECQETEDNNILAAKKTFRTIALPAIAGIITDAAGIYFLCLIGVPFLSKVGLYCGTWALMLVINVVILTPAVLALTSAKFKERKTLYLKVLQKIPHGHDRKVFDRANIAVWALVLVGSVILAWNVEIGDTSPGSPLLWPKSDYNVSASAINKKYFGDNKLVLLVSNPNDNTLKDPAFLREMDDFSRKYVLGLEEAGGRKSITDVVKYINKIWHLNDPKWSVIPNSKEDVGSYIFQYMIGAGVPGALKEYIDDDVVNGSLTIYFKDSKGSTITKAIDFLEKVKKEYRNLKIEVMGGDIGVFAAINEFVKAKNHFLFFISVTFIFLMVLLIYRDFKLAVIAIFPVLLGNYVTFAVMRMLGIGVNVNTLPVVTIGAGVGIDYTLYIMDRVLIEFDRFKDKRKAIREAVHTSGRAVLFTSSTMTISLLIWYFSHVRFIAEMGILLAVTLFVNALGALLLIPSLLRVLPVIQKEEPEKAVCMSEMALLETRG
jgi:predicted RND superfamily exporter protein